MRWKYVVLKRDGIEVPFVFPNTETHAHIARALNPNKDKVVSAGFCSHKMYAAADGDEMGWSCYGESTSLNVVSRNEIDERLFNRMLPC